MRIGHPDGRDVLTRFRAAVGLTVNLKAVGIGDLPRLDEKTSRIFDNRYRMPRTMKTSLRCTRGRLRPLLEGERTIEDVLRDSMDLLAERRSDRNSRRISRY